MRRGRETEWWNIVAKGTTTQRSEPIEWNCLPVRHARLPRICCNCAGASCLKGAGSFSAVRELAPLTSDVEAVLGPSSRAIECEMVRSAAVAHTEPDPPARNTIQQSKDS